MAVYYAQSAANIDGTNVWNTAANGSGSYLSWPPASGDVLMANNRAITVNVGCNLGSTGQVRNDNANGATAGGSFALTDGVTLTANVFAGSADCVTFAVASPAIAYGVGAVTGGTGSNADGVVNSGSGTISWTGNVTGGIANGTSGINNFASGTVIVTGSVTGGTSSVGSAYGVSNASSGRIEISGTCTASASSPAIFSVPTNVALLSGPFIGNASGVSALYCGAWRWLSTAGATYITVQTHDLTQQRSLYTADSVGGNPAASNVRYGTTYGPADELTGTAYIPAAASVLYGVPVDATTGTVTITASDIRDAIGLASANLDTQLAAIPTDGLTAQQVWEYVTRTLTAGSGITAQDVWEYATREITGGTVDTLTNSPDVPTEAEIAAQVRVELTPELSRIANCATVESTGDQLAGLL